MDTLSVMLELFQTGTEREKMSMIVQMSSKSKIYHRPGCQYLNRIKEGYLTLVELQKKTAGKLSPCKCCCKLSKMYRDYEPAMKKILEEIDGLAKLEENQIKTVLGESKWTTTSIKSILTNEKYIGDALLQKTYITDCISKKVKKNQGERAMYYVENNHPAIISREVFDQVRNEMTRRSSKRKVLQKSGKTELGKYSGKYALTELLVCGECGSPYKRVTWARNGKKRIVWRCVSRLEFGTKYCHNSPTLDESKPHSAILAAMNEFAAIRQEVCPDVLAMAEEAGQALSQAGARLLQLKKRMDAVSREQSDVLDRLLINMADTELNARMKALTDEKESLKAQIADAQQAEVNLEEQAARRRQMWDSIMECAAGYTEFDNELVRQVIQKITVEDAETIHIHFRDSDVVLEQEVE